MKSTKKVTLSVIKANVGGFVGHTNLHPDLIDTANELLHDALDAQIITDFHVLRCGDDMELIICHDKGIDSEKVHGVAWDTFTECTNEAKGLKLHGAGRDLLKDAMAGNVRGLGLAVAEIEFVERESEPVLVFMADKTSAGAWNLPLYKTFADPFNTAGLVMDAEMLDGFSFTILDTKEDTTVTLSCPEESHYLLALIGTTSRYMVTTIQKKDSGETAAVTSSEKLGHASGKYQSMDDPVCIVRCHAGLPTVGEALEPFALPHLVSGWLRGSHSGPLMAVPFYDSHPSRSDGPPRVICAGFQIANGHLIGPHDMFDDPSFDGARRTAGTVSEYLRRHGPFEPHRLHEDEMEHAAKSAVMEKLKKRFMQAS